MLFLIDNEVSKYTNKEYKFISEMIWGCAPIDKNWAEETLIFKDNAKRILTKYPLMDKTEKFDI